MADALTHHSWHNLGGTKTSWHAVATRDASGLEDRWSTDSVYWHRPSAGTDDSAMGGNRDWLSLGTGASHLFVRLLSCRESPDVLSSDTSWIQHVFRALSVARRREGGDPA